MGWGPIARACPDVEPPTRFSEDLLLWGTGIVCVFGYLFGIGGLVLARFGLGVAGIIAGTAALFFIISRVQRAPAESL